MKNLSLKSSLVLVPLLFLQGCVIPEMAVDVAKGIEITGKNSNSGGSSSNKSSNDKSIQKKMKSCLEDESVVREPLDEELDKVVLNFKSEKLEYLKNFGEKLNIETYWNDLDKDSYYEIDMLLIRQMNLLTTDKFNFVKNVIPYGVGHYLYTNKPDLTLYILTEDKDIPLVTLNFGKTKKDTEEKVIKPCLDFSFDEVKSRKSDQVSGANKMYKGHVRCTNKFNSRVDLKITSEDILNLEIKSKVSKFVTIHLSELDIVNKHNKVKIKTSSKFLAPRELKITLDKRIDPQTGNYLPQSVFSMDLRRFNSLFDRNSFSNMDCRNIIPLNLK